MVVAVYAHSKVQRGRWTSSIMITLRGVSQAIEEAISGRHTIYASSS